MKPTLIITGVVAVLLLLGLALGVGDTTSSSGSFSPDTSVGDASSDGYSSDGYSSSPGSGDEDSSEQSGLATFALVSGMLSIACVFVPTMPRSRQLLVGAVGIASSAYGTWALSQASGTYSFDLIFVAAPVVVIGWSGYGWYQNVQRGEGARGSLDDVGDPGPELVFPLAIRHGTRASVGLDIDADASPEAIRDAVGRALASRGNYFLTDGCAYSVLRHQPDGLDCAVVSGVRGVQQCTFAVRSSGTRVSVRLGDHRTVTETILWVIPIGPKTILGYGSYRHFLRTLAREVRRVDSGAGARVVQA